MGKRYPDYKTYADATLKDVFTASELEGATRLEANHLATTWFEQGPAGKFTVKKLPIEVQTSPIHALIALDYDKDGKRICSFAAINSAPACVLGSTTPISERCSTTTATERLVMFLRIPLVFTSMAK